MSNRTGPQQGWPTGPPTGNGKPPKNKWNKRAVAIFIIAFGLFIIVLGAVSSNKQPAAPKSGGVNGIPVTVTPYSALPAFTPDPQPVSPPIPAGPASSFGPGTWEVGVDILPGKYKSRGPGLDGYCYWSRLKADGEDIIDNDNPQGPVTVVIQQTDKYMEVKGCAEFVKQ